MDGSWDMGDDVCICLRTSFFSGFLTFSMMLEGCTFPPSALPPLLNPTRRQRGIKILNTALASPCVSPWSF